GAAELAGGDGEAAAGGRGLGGGAGAGGGRGLGVSGAEPVCGAPGGEPRGDVRAVGALPGRGGGGSGAGGVARGDGGGELGGGVARDPDLAQYPAGSTVTLTAVAGPGATFVEWFGDADGSGNPVTVTMDGDKTVTASFTDATRPATLTLEPVQPNPMRERVRI